MKKIYLLLAFICMGWLTYGQTTVTIYAGTYPGTDSVTGYASGLTTTITKDSIFSDAVERGYAVFNLSSIPSIATITSVVIGYNISNYTVYAGTASAWNIYGFAGDISLVTSEATMFSDCIAGTSLYTGNWGTTTGNQTQPTNGAAVGFVGAHIGGLVSMCFTSAGYVRYGFTGEDGTTTTTGAHAPYLKITYTCPPITPGPTASVCPGGTLTLTDSLGGGSWTSSISSVATVGDSTGIVTGGSTGSTIISYSNLGCVSTITLNVAPLPSISPLSSALCMGSTETLTDGASGGSWSSSSSSATISSGGVVTGVLDGTSRITYTVGSCTTTAGVTVNGPVPISPSTLSVCPGGTATFTDTSSSGSWSVTNSDASISGTGVVTGSSPGTDTVKYTVSGCSVKAIVNVSAGVSPISPASGVNVCIGTPVTLSDASAGGSWSSGTPGVATISSSGVVSGVTAGTTVISYSVGSCYATEIITVSAAPASISPSSASVCTSGSVTLSDATAGGAWSFSGSAIS